MRDMPGLVDSLVSYIEQEEKSDDKVTLTSHPASSLIGNIVFTEFFFRIR